jgi:hypothetical protein
MPDANALSLADAIADATARTEAGPAVDAAVAPDAAAAVDAAAVPDGGAPCNPNANFGMPKAVDELNSTANQDGARLTPSGLELYLTREDPVRLKKIHRYKRVAPDASWGTDTTEEALTIKVMSPDGEESASGYLTFASETLAYLSVFQGGFWKLFMTTRTGVGAKWNTPAPLMVQSVPSKTDEFPWLNSAGDKLYFMSGRIGAFKLFVAGAMGPAFPAAQQLAHNTLGTESQYAPVLSKDGATLYFAGYNGTKREIYKSTGSNFSITVKEPNLSIGTTNQLTWLSPDSCEAYLTVDGRIYKARRP